MSAPVLLSSRPQLSDAPKMRRDRDRNSRPVERIAVGSSVAIWGNDETGTLHRTREDARRGRRPIRESYGLRQHIVLGEEQS